MIGYLEIIILLHNYKYIYIYMCYYYYYYYYYCQEIIEILLLIKIITHLYQDKFQYKLNTINIVI